jgi:hypothetical protein
MKNDDNKTEAKAPPSNDERKKLKIKSSTPTAASTDGELLPCALLLF